MIPCSCIGPRPGHKLCPCREKIELERMKLRKLGLPTDKDRGVWGGGDREYFRRKRTGDRRKKG